MRTQRASDVLLRQVDKSFSFSALLDIANTPKNNENTARVKKRSRGMFFNGLKDSLQLVITFKPKGLSFLKKDSFYRRCG